MRSWNVGGYINRFLMIPPEYIEREFLKKNDKTFKEKSESLCNLPKSVGMLNLSELSNNQIN